MSPNRLPEGANFLAEGQARSAKGASVTGAPAVPDGEIRVLLADDSADDAAVLGFAIGRSVPGAATRWVEGGAQLFDAIAQWHPHIVLTDVHMPCYDIFDAIARIRAEHPALPVVVVSGMVGDETAAQLIRAGAADFVAKPGVARVGSVIERELRDARERAEHAALEARLHRTERRRQGLAQRLIDAQEHERRWLAQELHDDIGQAVAAMRLQLAHIAERSGGGPIGALAGEALASSEQLGQRLRQICLGLRPLELDDFGLAAALRSVVGPTRRAGPEVSVRVAGAEHRYAPAIETAAFRIAQEAIGNALRHSGCATLDVELAMQPEALTLTVRDDGCGFDVEAIAGSASGALRFGLAGMEERARAVGARFELLSTPGQGCTVRAHFAAPAGAEP